MEFKNCIVITGSIGCGKSSVCSILASKGYKIIDADLISRDVANKNLSLIAKSFGDDFIVDGALNREKLAKLIFSDKTAKIKLESIMHPLIKEEITREAQKLEKDNKIYFVDIPLFFETNNYKEFLPVAVVYAPKEAQIKRVLARNNISEMEALNRINSQMDIEQKVKMADFIIDNSGDISKLPDKVDNFLKEVENWFYKNTAQAETTF